MAYKHLKVDSLVITALITAVRSIHVYQINRDNMIVSNASEDKTGLLVRSQLVQTLWKSILSTISLSRKNIGRKY